MLSIDDDVGEKGIESLKERENEGGEALDAEKEDG